MTALRSLVFNVAFLAWTALFGPLFAPALLGSRRSVAGALRVWAAVVAWLLEHVVGLTTVVRGRDNIPDGAAVFASKHQSTWETAMFYRWLASPAFVVKAELARIPLYGWYATRSGSVPVARRGGTRALKAMVRAARTALDEGQQVVIFPEGTRTAPGQTRPYHPGVAALYTELAVPVVPVALNSGLFWARRSFIKRPGRVVVAFLPPIPPGLDRKRFMAELSERIETASAALTTGEAVEKLVDNRSPQRRRAL